jgi:hypothetical protein
MVTNAAPTVAVKDQADALREVRPDVLVILDACRADYATDAMGPTAAVRTPGLTTEIWFKAMAPLIREMNPIYFTANPVIHRTCESIGLDLDIVDVWRNHWGRHTALRIPSVHPHSMNGVVMTHHELGLLSGRMIVVHYIQPHTPFIGDVPLAVAAWGRSTEPNEMWEACHAMPNPEQLVSSGQITWEGIRNAYRANLQLVRGAVEQLVRGLEGHIVVTADHGEALGEESRFGHAPSLDLPVTRLVPWYERQGGSGESATMREKLVALGYVT